MEQQEEGRSTATANGSTSRAGRIGRPVLALMALGGVIAVVAYYCSHSGYHSSKAAVSTATKDGAAIQPMSFTTLNDVVSELDAKIKAEQTEAAIEVAKQAGAAGANIVNSTNSKANATGMPGGVFFSSVPQVQQKPFQVKVPAANNKAPSESTCVAADYDELKDAIENDNCQFVTLVGTEYEMEDEIIVSRSVTVTGTPQTMPTLNNEDAPRAFRVVAGGFLEARFIQFVMSEGVIRDPLPWEGATSPKVIEVRGGSVLFEAGAIGGNFVNCFFLDDRDVGAGLQAAIDQTIEQVSVRIYGGHIFAVNGNINLYNCLIFDLTILYPLTNFLIIGGDVLNLAGTINFVACTWLETTLFGVENGVGLFVANIAGVTLYTFNNFEENNAAVMENCLGQAYMTGGGVQVMTTSLINEFSGIVAYTGSGELTVLGGVSILTGIGNVEAFGIGTSIGIGMEYTVGPGAVVHTGASMIEYNGIFFMAALGELSFVASGFWAATGSPMQEYLAISGEFGQGGSFWMGSGYASFIGSPQIEADSIAGVYLTGEYICNDAGFLVWIGCPVLEFVPIEHGGNVIGSIIYIGMGALVIGGSPVYEAYTELVTPTVEFWIGGTCETEGGEGTTQTGAGGETTRSLEVSAFERQLYDLPWFVAPMEGCQKIVGMFEKPYSGISSGGSSGSGGESSRSLPALPQPDPNRVLIEKQAQAALAPGKQRGPTSHLPHQVRRHATNYHRPKGDRRLMEQKDSVPNVGLFGFNMQRHSNEYDLSSLEGLVPAKTIETLAGLKEKMVEINGGKPLETTTDRPLFHIDSKVDGYCGLCNVDGAEGPGATYCERKDNCADLENAPASVLSKMDAAKAATDDKTMEFDEHFLVLAEMTPTTTADVEALDMSELQEAVVTAIAHLQGADDLDREAVIVNVYSAVEDPHWADLMPAPRRNLQATDIFSKTHNFKFVTIATDRATSEMLVQAMLPEVAGEESPLAKQIKETFKAHTGIEIGHVGLEYDREMYVPAYNSDSILNHDRRHLGTHSTILVDPEKPAVPITHVEYKRQYHILLEHYPPHVQLDVRLMRLKDDIHEDLPLEAPVALPVKAVTTNADGEAAVKFVFDHGSVRPGEYFVQTTFPDGHAAFSPTYVVSHAGAKRRLYGPHMEVAH